MLNRRLLRVKVIQVLYAYFLSSHRSLNSTEKELFFSLDKTFDLYHNLMNLLFDLQRVAESRIAKAKNKRVATFEDLNPNMRFVNNRLLKVLYRNTSLISHLRTHKLSWVNYPEVPLHLFDKLIETDTYKEYMSSTTDSFTADKNLVMYILEFVFAENEMLFNTLEEMSIYWLDDFEYVISMIIKTIRGFTDKTTELTRLMPMFKNDEDRQFAVELLRKTVLRHQELIEIVDKYTINWDIERVAFMDKIILQMAICEILEFQSIPTKVTFNEYIELAKFYSTPKSSIFINGILDRIVTSFIEEGRINKSDLEEISTAKKASKVKSLKMEEEDEG